MPQYHNLRASLKIQTLETPTRYQIPLVEDGGSGTATLRQIT